MIYHIQRYCVHDGNGIRTTVFFKGCQLRCPWCANPESQEADYQIGYYEEKCIHCKICEKICPKGAVKEGKIEKELCIQCGSCVEECPAEALCGFGRKMSIEEIVDAVCKDLPFYRKSGGGVTFSGGEATMQPDLLLELISRLKNRGIHIALESHGLFSDALCSRLMEGTDQFLIDLKHADDAMHKQMLGVSNAQIIKNLHRLSGRNLTIRIPLIEGFNDSSENLKKSAELAKQVGAKIDILPFHNYGTGKYKALGMNYAYAQCPVYPEEKLEACKDILRSENVLFE